MRYERMAWLSALIGVAVGVSLAHADCFPKAPSATLPGVPLPLSLSVGDVNGDGKPDLIVSSWVRVPGPTEKYDDSKSRVLLFYQKDGAYKMPADRELAVKNPMTTAAGDFDRDGKPDLVVSPYGPVMLFLGKEDFKTGHECPDINGGGGQMLAAKLDKEGVFDFLSGPVWRKWLGADDWHHGYFYGPTENDNRAPVVADLDMDGQPDLLFQSKTPTVRLYYGPFLNMLVHTQDLGKFVTLNAPGPVGWLAVGDLNGDGRPDVIASASWDTDVTKRKVSIWLQDSPVGFADKAKPTTGIEGLCGQIVVADVNKDGLDDLIVAEAGDTKVHLFLQKKDKPFATSIKEADETLSIGANHMFCLSDLNGDGYLDLVHNDGTTIRIFMNQGAAPKEQKAN